MINISVDTTNIAKLARQIEQAKRSLVDSSLIESTIKKAVAQANEANILTQGKRIGSIYPKLSTTYARQKQRRGQGNKILVATGALLQSVKEESRLQLTSTDTATGYKITVFTDSEIARFAESGIKKRRIFGLNGADLKNIVIKIEANFLKALRG